METDSFKILLSRVKQITLDAYAHQAYPFDALIEELDLQRDLSRSALFDVIACTAASVQAHYMVRERECLDYGAYDTKACSRVANLICSLVLWKMGTIRAVY